MQAYVELRDDPTWTARPLNFSTLRFLSISTATGDVYWKDLANGHEERGPALRLEGRVGR